MTPAQSTHVGAIQLRKHLLQLMRRPLRSTDTRRQAFARVQDQMWSLIQHTDTLESARLLALVAGLQAKILLAEIRENSRAVT